MPRKTKQNDITSPELLRQVNPDNMRLKQDFLDYLRSVQRSPKTIAGYDNDIDIFWVWNLTHNGNANNNNASNSNGLAPDFVRPAMAYGSTDSSPK